MREGCYLLASNKRNRVLDPPGWFEGEGTSCEFLASTSRIMAITGPTER
jgi:hypothetical protein